MESVSWSPFVLTFRTTRSRYSYHGSSALTHFSFCPPSLCPCFLFITLQWDMDAAHCDPRPRIRSTTLTCDSHLCPAECLSKRLWNPFARPSLRASPASTCKLEPLSFREHLAELYDPKCQEASVQHCFRYLPGSERSSVTIEGRFSLLLDVFQSLTKTLSDWSTTSPVADNQLANQKYNLKSLLSRSNIREDIRCFLRDAHGGTYNFVFPVF